MPECEYCGESFDSKINLHLHWSKEHGDELNSHQEEKVKRAKRKRKEDKQKQKNKLVKYGTGAAVLVLLGGLALVISPSILQSFGGPDVPEEDLDLDRQPVKGDPDADTWVVEFGDYRCPACQTFEESILPQIEPMIEQGEVAFYYMDLNLDMFQPGSERASVAAQCVLEQDQEQFWNYHGALYQNLDAIEYNTEGLMNLAEESTEDLDYEDLETCIREEQTIEAVNLDNQIAEDFGITSTPTVIVNGSFVDAADLPSEIQ